MGGLSEDYLAAIRADHDRCITLLRELRSDLKAVAAPDNVQRKLAEVIMLLDVSTETETQ